MQRIISLFGALFFFGWISIVHGQTLCPVLWDSTGSNLSLCNNLIMNNPFSEVSTNIPNPDSIHNILVDHNLIFVNPDNDFRVLRIASIVLNNGANNCLSFIYDISGNNRISDTIVDIGAFEWVISHYFFEFYPVYQDEGNGLLLCNNIIINNGVEINTNLDSLPITNWVENNDTLFVDPLYDFQLSELSPAINTGNSSCSSWSSDLLLRDRVNDEQIDMGVFEYTQFVLLPQYALFDTDSGSLVLCNNIVVNNGFHHNVNVDTLLAHNIFTNQDNLFIHPLFNFNLLVNSVAVNTGKNDCTPWGEDFTENSRIIYDTVDIGAFERYTYEAGYPVFQEEIGGLELCNNIIINNYARQNTNIETLSITNLVEDSLSVFCNDFKDFQLLRDAVAIDLGDSTCVNFVRDLRYHFRILGNNIDAGAFEALHFDSLYAVLEEEDLLLCNNIIINQHFGDNTNISNPPWSNITQNSDSIFIHRYHNFNLREHSPAIDSGDNSCSLYAFDLAVHDRIINNRIDIGAYERKDNKDFYPVYQELNSSLTLCNNIIINNFQRENTNIETLSEDNIVENSSTLFVNPNSDFRLTFNSIAVDAGNDVCPSWSQDIQNNDRIIGEQVDIGAYELVTSDYIYTVFQEDDGNLNLCNNIIINNITDADFNVSPIPNFNMIGNNDTTFVHNTLNFKLVAFSAAIDTGNNSCCSLPFDIDTTNRITNGIIDLGAFEFPIILDSNGLILAEYNLPPTFTLYEEYGGNLNLCNNIIINNITDYNLNINPAPVFNLVTDNDSTFSHNYLDFTLLAISLAVNMGNNTCCSLPVDLKNETRIYNDTIDLGAYEYTSELIDSTYAIYQESLGSLILCNNIIINNITDHNTNIVAFNNNITNDNDSIFIHNTLNFSLLRISEAVDTGINDCCHLAVDLNNNPRIFNELIDYGAFEYFYVPLDSIVAVYQDTAGHLALCNNIIINNITDFNVNIIPIQPFNLIEDNDNTFSHNYLDFSLLGISLAIDNGNNSCCILENDLKYEIRIFNDTIDLGAYEYAAEYFDSTYAVYQENGGELILCNNIIINNITDINLNIDSLSSFNMTEDNDTVFIHNTFNFTLLSISEAVNSGNNLCCTLENDIKESGRIFNDTIDLGAYEYFFIQLDSTYATYQDTVGTLLLCNNIIINNICNENINCDSISSFNLLQDNDTTFIHNTLNFTLLSISEAVNGGNNVCCDLETDIKYDARIHGDTIDLGAYEYAFIQLDSVYAVYQDTTGTLYLCNNIVINNPYVNDNYNGLPSTNANIFADNYELFVHNTLNFKPVIFSIAVDSGNNSCCNLLYDISGELRIHNDTIEIGAYELFERTTDSICVVYEEEGGHLQLYNNIIINNKRIELSISESIIGSHNLLTDLENVFTDVLTDFRLADGSPAIDAGDNQYINIEKDLKDEIRFACAGVVDQGAYEFQMDDLVASLAMNTVTTGNCSGEMYVLTASEGMYYEWSHSNESGNVVEVNPIVPTTYSVIISNGGICTDTASIEVVPANIFGDLSEPSTSGQHFWVSFMKNHFSRNPTLTLLVSAQNACTGTVTNPRTGWSTNFSVGNNSTTYISVPSAQAYNYDSENINDYGLFIESTDMISVFASNFTEHSYDVTAILPIDALSSEYIVQTYQPLINAEFLIVATENNTIVDITPSRRTLDGRSAGRTFSITLQQGQTYQVLSAYGGSNGDLSGSIVTARGDKKIALFNGNVCAHIPVGNAFCDHVVEQAFGTDYWGTEFAVTSSQGQNFDRVKITASRNQTSLYKNGVLLTTLQANQTFEFNLEESEGSCFLKSSHPIAVYLYIAGGQHGSMTGHSDPAMIWIPPIEQKITEITFSTFQTSQVDSHFVNIVTPTTGIATLTLDGTPINIPFQPVNGNSNWSFVKKQIPHGTHTLSNSAGFIAHIYGLGDCESYGYMAGSKTAPLTQQMFVDGILSTELPHDLHYCTFQDITFSSYLNYECDSIVWNFGDSTPTVTGTEAIHNFSQSGTYFVSMTIYLTNEEQVICTDIRAQLFISEGYSTTYYDTICQGIHYQQYGFDFIADTSGNLTYSREVEISDSECDSTYLLYLSVIQSHYYLYDSICVNNLYAANGFNIMPTETGHYYDTITYTRPLCDSIVILDLLSTPNIDNFSGIIGDTFICTGQEYTYTIDSLFGFQQIVWNVPEGCEISSGQGSNTIVVYFYDDTIAGNIAFSALNECGYVSYHLAISSLPTYYIQLQDSVCEGELYTGFGFENILASSANSVFIQELASSQGCDSTIVLSLNVISYEVTDTLILCSYQLPYAIADTEITAAGDYQLTLSSLMGCDSVVNYHIIVIPALNFVMNNVDTSLCYGESTLLSFSLSSVDSTYRELDYLWNTGETTPSITILPDSTSLYSVTISDQFGCSYSFSQTISLYPTYQDTIYATIYYGDSYEENGFIITDSSTHIIGTLTTTNNMISMNGCDSTLTLILNVISNINAFNDTIIHVENEIDTINPLGNDSLMTLCDSLFITLITSSELGTATIDNDMIIYQPDSALYGIDSLQYLLNCNGNIDSAWVFIYVIPVINLYDTICAGRFYSDYGFEISSDSTLVVGEQLFTTHSPSLQYNCDSITNLHLFILPNTSLSIFDTIGLNNIPYSMNGINYYSSGIYNDTLQNVNGCDSIVSLNLTILPNIMISIDSIICENSLPLTWYNIIFNEAMSHNITLASETEIDTILTLNLIVKLRTDTTLFHTIVENDLPYTWNGVIFDTSGTENIAIPNANGCDSVITMNLTVNWNSTLTIYDTVCQGEPYMANGFDISAEETQTAGALSGTFIETLHATSLLTGSDSATTLHLTINQSFAIEFLATACDTYTWNQGTYTTSGDYTQTFDAINGCDSVVTLHLTINPSVETEFSATACDIYTWNGQNYTTSNDYTQTLTTIHGCDSTVTLHLIVNQSVATEFTATACDSYTWNGQTYTISGDYTQTFDAANGCDSTVTLHLTINPSFATEFSATACDTYTWNQETYTASGDYTQTFEAINGCDSVVTLHLIINPSVTTEFSETSCDTYTWNGQNYTTSNDYTQTLTTVHGCDSTVTLHLTINPSVETEFTATACDSYTWDQETFTTSGDYTQTLTTIHGCDSVVTLHLTLNPSVETEFSATACDTYTWNGQNYTTSNDYTQTFTTVHGCDSTVTLHLTIKPSVETEFTETACDTYTWNGQNYTSTGDYVQTFDAANGCDSVVTLHLTINPSVATEFIETACDSYTWNGQNYTSTGDYVQTFDAANGCDSVVTLHLTINPSVATEFTVTTCVTYTWNGQNYTTTGDYTQTLTTIHDCDSIVTLHLTINPSIAIEFTETACDTYTWNQETYTASGDYVQNFNAANGCDSMVTLHLTINPSVETEFTATACDTYTWNGQNYITTGDYTQTLTTVHDCDSTVTLHLTINPSVATEFTETACDSYTWNGQNYTTSGDYTQTLTTIHGCDSTVTLHLTINPSIAIEFTETACDTYTWNQETYTASGDYVQTFNAANGCDSVVTLHLTINQSVTSEFTDTACDSYTWNGQNYTTSGDYTQTLTTIHGCDSAVTLHLTINQSVGTEFADTACDTFTWNGQNYTSTGDYVQTFEAANGCDSVVTLHLTINPSVTTEFTVTTCVTYTWNGQNYTTTGDYTQTLTTIHGCDSVVTLHLTINSSVATEFSATACDTYTWNGQNYTSTGDYTQTLTTIHGCDSVVTLHLTINQSVTTEFTETACDTYTWNGQTYTTTGDYTQTLTTIHGCDSVVTLHLTINPSIAIEFSETACDAYTWNGQNYTSTGDYTQTLTTIRGCDSTVTLHLTINPSVETEFTDTACDSYTWNGQHYTTSNDYSQTLTTIHGCDSVVTLHLTINQSVATEFTATACDSYTWNGQNYTTSGDYTQILDAANGCDSTVTLHLTINISVATEFTEIACDTYTWNQETYTTSGDYTQMLTTIHGCDSLVTLHLTINPSIETDIYDTICQGEPYIANGFDISAEETQTAGVVIETVNSLSLQTGCDSATTLHLTIKSNSASTLNMTIVENDLPYTWNGVTFDTSGTQITTIPNANGCDSIITMILTVLPNTHEVQDTTICYNFLPLTWHGLTFNAAGSQNVVIPNEDGSDHIITYTVHTNNLPQISFTGFTNPICPFVTTSQSISSTITDGLPPYQYVWSGDSLTVLPDNTVIMNLEDAICGSQRFAYLLVIDNNGCQNRDTALLIINDTQSPIISASLPAQPAIVNNCVFTVPDITTLVSNAVSDNCSPVDSLQISQTPAVGTIITTTTNVVSTIIDQCGNSSTTTISITVPLALTASISNPTYITCYGESTGAATTSVTGGTLPYTYQWSATATPATIISTTASIANRPAGSYTVTISDANGCTTTASVTLNTLNGQMMAGTISQNQNICFGNNASALTGTVASGGVNSHYQWQVSTNGNTFSAATGTNSNQTYTPAAITQTLHYRRAWISTACGTVYSNVIVITVFPVFNDTLYAQVCEDHPYQENGFNFTSQETATPSTLSQTQSLNTIHGCDSIITLLLTILPSYYDTIVDATCQHSPYQNHGFDVTAEQTAIVELYTETHTITTQSGCDSVTTLLLNILPSYSTNYEDEICEGTSYQEHGFDIPAAQTFNQGNITLTQYHQTTNGCDSIINLSLNIIDTSIYISNLTSDFCEDFTAVLQVNTALTNYEWSTGEQTSTIEIHNAGTYSITASYAECSSEATFTLPPCEFELYLPNAITPTNEDNLNDYFAIHEKTQRQIEEFEISIFNRWGELVFHSTDKNFKWHGDNKGQVFHNIVYSYVIRLRNIEGRKLLYTGSITVL